MEQFTEKDGVINNLFHVEHDFVQLLTPKKQSPKMISGLIPDFKRRKFISVNIIISNGKIIEIQETSPVKGPYILPGFVDAHIHVESSLLPPSEFVKLVVPMGTLSLVADPHEIANVLGIQGIYQMKEDSRDSPIPIMWAAPSCVPATNFETSGGKINAKDVQELFSENICSLLGEVMNFPAVLNEEIELINKINLARENNLPIDGHAPALLGKDLIKYCKTGISTDHECTSYEEALEKVRAGMKIIIREGSAARNFESLFPLISEFPDKVMLCTDDCHPDYLESGHINKLIKLGLEKGISIFDLLQVASLNPIEHYKIPLGTLQIEDSADFVLVDSLESFKILECWIKGKKIQIKNSIKKCYFDNPFYLSPIQKDQIQVSSKPGRLKVIEAMDGSLVTNQINIPISSTGEFIFSNISEDILKIIICNRYKNSSPQIGFIKGFNLKKGAIASSVAHDSHNILAVGSNDDDLEFAINQLIQRRGGLIAVSTQKFIHLPLPFAGLMSDKSGPEVIELYKKLNSFVRTLGCNFQAPFMTLSFMALLVIPKLKISDKGLFDSENFSFTPLIE